MESIRKKRTKTLLEGLSKKNIYLYGAGIRGSVALNNLISLKLGQNVRGFIDDCIQVREGVYSIENVRGFKDNNAVFIITTYNIKEMTCKLMQYGVSPEAIHFFPELLIDDIEIDIFRRHADKIAQVYNILEDNFSKYLYKSIFEIYLDGNIGILSRTKGDIQYFPIQGTGDFIDRFHIIEKECFIDCGAYDGDTIRSFKKVTGNKFKKIWAFEPDYDNYLKLSDYVKKEQDTRIQLINGGVYNKDSELFFNGNRGTTSTLVQTGEKCIKVFRLDSVIREPVTYIKMDIEGAEGNALLGARGIISKYKPKLAICIYHKIEDFWEIPLLIKRLNPDYHLYIRNYEDRIDETVCYAF